MKGQEPILAKLNELLADELTAINQYMVHSEMCANWGYERLHEAIEKRAIEEMKHAEKLIARILFLEGLPIVSQPEPDPHRRGRREAVPQRRGRRGRRGRVLQRGHPPLRASSATTARARCSRRS